MAVASSGHIGYGSLAFGVQNWGQVLYPSDSGAWERRNGGRCMRDITRGVKESKERTWARRSAVVAGEQADRMTVRTVPGH